MIRDISSAMEHKEPLPPIQLQSSITQALEPGRTDGNWKNSFDQLTQLHSLPEVVANPEYEAQVLVARGLTHRMLGNYEQADTDFIRVQMDLLPSSDHQDRYLALIGLADIYRLQGNTYQAHLILQEAMQQEEPTLSQAKAFDQAGLIWTAQGKVDVSIFWYQQALSIAEELIEQSGQKLPDQPPELQELVANILNHLGVAQEQLGQASAIKTQKQALKVYKAIANQRGQLNTLIALGRIQANREEYRKALRYYDKAAAFTGSNPRAEASLYLSQAEAYYKLGNIVDAKHAWANFNDRRGPDNFNDHDEGIHQATIEELETVYTSEDK